MRYLNKWAFIQIYNSRHQCDGQFFRGRYKSILIDNDRTVVERMKKRALIIVSTKADLSFPNVSIGNPVMCYSEHRFRLKTCRNDIVLAETMTKAKK